MQCKDIPNKPILEFLTCHGGIGCNWYGNEYERSVTHAMPENIPPKLALAKMKVLIRNGLVGGCPCGCRGDFEITEKGRLLVTEEIIGGRSNRLFDVGEEIIQGMELYYLWGQGGGVSNWKSWGEMLFFVCYVVS